MKKIILMLTDGNIDHASSRIRAINYIPLLENLPGYSAILIPRIPLKKSSLVGRLMVFPFIKRLLKIKRFLFIIFFKAEIIFIQRLFLSSLELYILKKRRMKFIYDFDDAIYQDTKNRLAYSKTKQMVQAAYKVIISTPYLKEFCLTSGKSAQIITSPVDIDKYYPRSPKPSDHVLTIGWTGSHFTTKYLNLIAGPLQRTAREYNIRFLVIGASSDFQLGEVKVEIHKWDPESEPDLIRQMDIGIMPLTDDEWSRSKGGYKLFLFMATGIPVVASPVGINSLIVKPGINGFLASSEEEWYLCLKQLIDNELMRKSYGQNGLAEARLKYSRSACFERLKEEIIE